MYTDTINGLFSCKQRQHCHKSPRFTSLQSHKVKHNGTHTHTPYPDTGLGVIPLSCLCHLQIRLAHISSAIVIARPRACYCSSLAWWRHARQITNKPCQMQRKLRQPQAKKIERVSGFLMRNVQSSLLHLTCEAIFVVKIRKILQNRKNLILLLIFIY